MCGTINKQIKIQLQRMATTPEQLNNLLAIRSENQRLEFKEAKVQFDNKKLYKYCVAIANEGGGKLILGVSDQLPRKVIGTKAFRDTTKMEQKLFQAIKFRVDIEEVMHHDGRVLVIHIPSRPRGTAYPLKGVYLMRVGEELLPMSEDKLRQIFSEGKPDWLNESSKSGLSNQEIIDLLDTQKYFELLKLPYPTNQDGIIDRLLNDRLIVSQDGGHSILRLSALLLAKRLEDFPELTRKSPRVVVYTGNSKLRTRLDKTRIRGYAVDFQDLVDFVMSHLPQNEVIEGAIRKEDKLVSETVIRELVANALIHQDFTISGTSMMVEIYSNRVEISNPGEPVVPVERFIDGYKSRNESLARIMRQLGICEEKSSGIDRVIFEVEFSQLPAPYFHVGQERTMVTIYGTKSFEKMNRTDRTRACYQHCALKWVTSGRMTNQSLRERFGLSESKSAVISQVIAATAEEGLIKLDKRVGTSRKFACYLPFWA